MSSASAGAVSRQNPADRLPDETTVANEAADLFENPDVWLDTEHPMLGGKRPRACVGTADEQAVWDLLRTTRRVGQT
jgi:uncharacterized protein (DUF2384 family)